MTFSWNLTGFSLQDMEFMFRLCDNIKLMSVQLLYLACQCFMIYSMCSAPGSLKWQSHEKVGEIIPLNDRLGPTQGFKIVNINRFKATILQKRELSICKTGISLGYMISMRESHEKRHDDDSATPPPPSWHAHLPDWIQTTILFSWHLTWNNLKSQNCKAVRLRGFGSLAVERRMEAAVTRVQLICPVS
jgi:hypothetical protein